MKKNIEWLEEEIGKLPCTDAIFKVYNDEYHFTATHIHSAVPVKGVYELIDQLDELEVLSQGWINKHAKAVSYDGMPDDTEVVYVDDLQNLLVPKQGVSE